MEELIKKYAEKYHKTEKLIRLMFQLIIDEGYTINDGANLIEQFYTK